MDKHLLEMFLTNHATATKEVSKLIGLLSVKKNVCSPTINGEFSMDIRRIMSGFMYTASTFDPKNLHNVKYDLSCLLDDGIARKVTVGSLFDTRSSKDIDVTY